MNKKYLKLTKTKTKRLTKRANLKKLQCDI